MDFVIIPVVASLLLFSFGFMYTLRKDDSGKRDGVGSFPQIACYFFAAAFMYLAVYYFNYPNIGTPYQVTVTFSSYNVLFNTTNQGLNPNSIIQYPQYNVTSYYNQNLANTALLQSNPNAVFINEWYLYLYIALCFIFMLAGILERFGSADSSPLDK